MKARRLIFCCFFVMQFSIALGDSVCDFNGDQLSEVPFVTRNSSGSYDWTAYDPRSGLETSIARNFGNASSVLIPGNWLHRGEAVPAIVNPASPGITGRATWLVRYLGYDQDVTFSRSLGRPGDVIIQGGDYDGNGISDSLILKKTTGMLGLRVDYFQSTYNGNNLGTERLYKALGSPFRDYNFFFSPDGGTDYLAVLRRGRGAGNSILKLKPFTDSPQVLSIGTLPGGSFGPLPLKQGPGQPDLLAFYAPRSGRVLVTVKTIGGLTVFKKTVAGLGPVTVGDYFADKGWELAIQNQGTLTIINPVNRSIRNVPAPTGLMAPCVTNQTIN